LNLDISLTVNIMTSLMRIFSTSKQNNGKAKKHSRKDSEATLVPSRDGVHEREIMQGAERELYRYNQPKQELGMSDLIRNHQSGTRFMYAAVTGKESEELESKLRRLVSFQPKLNRTAIPFEKLPVIKLYNETESFPLNEILYTSSKKLSQEYIRLSDAIVLYGAVVSPDCEFTKVQVGIADNRLLSNKMAKSFTATSNMMSRGNLSLPYCIPRADADQLVLSISRERAFLTDNRQWGAIQIQLTVEFTDFPVQFENQEIAALNMVTPSALEDRINNPNNIDVSILNQDRMRLAELFRQGEIVNETEPIENKMAATKYAKSSIMGQPKGKQLEPAAQDWSFLNSRRVGQIDQDQNSVDPEEDGIEYKPPSIRSVPDDVPEGIWSEPDSDAPPMNDVRKMMAMEYERTQKKLHDRMSSIDEMASEQHEKLKSSMARTEQAMNSIPSPPKPKKEVGFSNKIERLTPY